MKNASIEILKSFSQSDLDKFNLFIESPYFNSGKPLKNLYYVLREFYPDYNNPKLTKELLYRKLKNFNDATLRNSFADLNKFLIKFLFYNYMEDADEVRFIYIFEEFVARNLHKHFEKERTAYLKYLKNPKKPFSVSDLFHKYKFQIAEYNFYGFKTKELKKKNPAKTIRLQNIIGNTLTNYYMLESLKDWINLKWQEDSINPETISKVKPLLRTYFKEEKMTDDIFMSLINEETNKNIKLIYETYYLIYKSYRDEYEHEERVKVFKELLVCLKKLMYSKSDYEVEYITAVSRNVITRFTFSNVKEKYLDDEIDNIYLNVFSHNKQPNIPSITFSRILFGSIIDNKYQKAETIIVKYLKYVITDNPEFYNSLLMLFNKFTNGEFKEAEILIRSIKSKDINAKRYLKYFKIMIYYELRDFDKVFSNLESLIKYNQNHKFENSKIIYQYTTEFCRSIKLLSDYLLSGNKKKFDELKYSISISSNVFIHNKFKELENLH